MVRAAVVTKYNSKTYRIDEVDFTRSPLSTFEFEGRQTSFSKYYSEKYKEKIIDQNQCLLVS